MHICITVHRTNFHTEAPGNRKPFARGVIRKLLASECGTIRDHLLRLDLDDRANLGMP